MAINKLISTTAVNISPQRNTTRKSILALSTSLLCYAAFAGSAFAQEPDGSSGDSSNEIVVTGALNALPVKDVGTIFGFNKTLVETPRSASTISNEQMERFGANDIYDLMAQSPGTFTNSFFGVGGALDIRGTPGEIYFRGMRRLDNPGNYPQPIGASDRIDIVRGPASPIMGPSKTGGYMNFVPRTARVQGGKLLSSPEGEIQYTTGSWSKSDLSASIRGPGKIGSQEFGYSLYGEIENSGSYYRNMSTKQTILQAAFDTDLSSNIRIEFGGMYHDFKGQQNGGWNRLTQDLVDNGTYITGSAQPVDTSGNGQIEPTEIQAIGNFNPFFFGGPASVTPAALSAYPWLAITNVGTTQLSHRDTLTGPNDTLNNKVLTGYFDIIFDAGNDWEIKNQLFYDGYDNTNMNTYGFSQFHNSYVIENKITVSKTIESDIGKFSFQASPSLRYTNFLHADDHNFEYFHRVDLTKGYDALSDRLLSLECDCDYSTYFKGDYTDISMAGLVDLDFNFGLDITAGLRYDSIHVNSSTVPTKLRSDLAAPYLAGTSPSSASDTKGDWSWTGSISYKLPFGLIPYGTIARQTTVIAGQGAEIELGNTLAGTFLSASKLYEGGIKGTWLGGKLYAALSVYKQNRTDYSSQSLTVNQAIETKGIEAEMRWSVDRHTLITAAYTKTKVYNLTMQTNGTAFSFFGIEDLKKVPAFAGMTDSQIGALMFGGQPGGLLPIPNAEASRRAGIPENLFSATATYAFDNGLAFAVAASHVQSVFSGQSQAVKLPAYTLVDVSASYTNGPWLFRVVCKNCTDTNYFRANFTELFGSTIVLPEKPRSWQASVVYKF